jgi:hypothetical protein
MKNIIWLASYPKSGNTWVRSMLTCLLNNAQPQEQFINELIAPIISSRSIIDEYLLLETSELTNEEIDTYTPTALRELSKSIAEEPFFMKAHNAYTYTKNGEPLYPSDASKGAIYIVRNVLDVTVSFAHHNNDTIENTIKTVSDDIFLLLSRTDDIKYQTPQKLLSWSKHVEGWSKQNEIPLLLIRYEDLVQDTFNVLKEIVKFSGLQYTDEAIAGAVESTAFDKLKAQEAKHGFGERKVDKKPFFRKGKIGSWRESLSKEQALGLIDKHREIMQQMGYLDSNNTPLF